MVPEEEKGRMSPDWTVDRRPCSVWRKKWAKESPFVVKLWACKNTQRRK